MTDPKEVVRRGYDAVSMHYRGDDDDAGQRGAWMRRLGAELTPGASVLDLGCGCGVPVARLLVDAGFTVTGVDISDIQIERARALVPTATFLRADASEVAFATGSFDAIVCLYLLIHLPLDEQPPLLSRMASWLPIAAGSWMPGSPSTRRSSFRTAPVGTRCSGPPGATRY